MNNYNQNLKKSQMVKYICGKCKGETDIDTSISQPPVCNKCGYKVLYKKREKKVIQYVAR